MAEKAFIVDVEKCTSCKMCVVACKDEHVDNQYAPWSRPQPETGQFWVDIVAQERGRQPRLKMSYLPLFCQHCANAPCIKACPEQAIETRPDGIVWINSEKCTGCGLCEPSCPYDVIFMNEELGLAQKCTGCAHRVDEGKLPRCADVCPHDAIVFGDTGDAAFAAKLKDGVDYHPEFLAAPRVKWKGLPKPWIAGTFVDDAADEVLAGVTLKATDLFDGGTTMATSDGFGDAWIKGLEPDRKYRVEIAKPGYETVLEIVTTSGDQDLGTVKLKKR